MTPETKIALDVRGMSVGYALPRGGVKRVVESLDLQLRPGRIVGLAGESGSGKTTAALAAIGHMKRGIRILSGQSLLDGETDILKLTLQDRKRLWGSQVAYVPQSAAMSLNPGTPIGKQLAQVLRQHMGTSGDELRDRQIELLTEMGLPEPDQALKKYSFQFSGGQQQRISLAIALACNPRVLVLDEPTTGLDVTTQARLTELLKRLVAEHSLSALYISHDLAVLGKLADDIAVMYAGEVVERSSMQQFLARPRHPYAQALFDVTASTEGARLVPGIPGTPPGEAVLDSCAFAPRCVAVEDRCCTSHPTTIEVGPNHTVSCLRIGELEDKRMVGRGRPGSQRDFNASPLLDVRGVDFTYPGASEPSLIKVHLKVMPGERVGIVGESGSGKSTLLRVIAGLAPDATGTFTFDSKPLDLRIARRPRETRRAVQLIFQNPDSSLNPRHTVGEILLRPIRYFRDDVPRSEEKKLVTELLDAVRMPASFQHRFPRELSGGQRQRVAIARAFAAGPQLLLCDEVTSALDVSVQAAVLELLTDLSQRTGTGIVFVGHDLAVVRTVAERALVMRNGEVIEEDETDRLLTSPSEAYTKELVNSSPKLVNTPIAHTPS